jgi:hypothetical protein
MTAEGVSFHSVAALRPVSRSLGYGEGAGATLCTRCGAENKAVKVTVADGVRYFDHHAVKGSYASIGE